jgi:putative autoinducer-2 (AI-2) aldolase
MPEVDGDAKNFFADVPPPSQGFFLKGSGSLDWGMRNRLARVFRPDTGRTVMLAIDHGYFQGPTTGLERVDVTILPLVPLADALMCTRGILRSTVPPSSRTPVVLRASGGPSILKELSDERIAVDIEDAVRLNVAALAVQVFVGGEHETQSVHNMTRLVDLGLRYGIPVMGDARREVHPAGLPHMRRARRAVGQDVLRGRRFRHSHRVLPGADRDGRRQEAARA